MHTGREADNNIISALKHKSGKGRTKSEIGNEIGKDRDAVSLILTPASRP
jgi:hypothetical protein